MRVLVRSIVGVALLALGAAGGAAVTARPAPKVVSAAPPPVEVRTVVRRRTVHVYRKPRHPRRRPAPVATTVPPPAPTAAPAPVRVIQPAAPSRPLVTRTSGSGGGGEREHDGEDEGRGGEHDD